MAAEECEEQCLDVLTIDIRICHDDDFMVADFLYIECTFLITITLYFLFGLGSESTTAVTQEIVQKYSHAPGMLMLFPICIVLFLAIKGRTVFEALTYGIISGMIIGLVSGLLTPADIFHIEGDL